MSKLILNEDHKNHLEFLATQPSQVLQDFCKLSTDFLQKGHNYKFYTNAAQKLEVEPDNIKHSIEGLIYLIIESCKNKLTPDDFKELVISLGFTNDKESLLSNLYTSKQSEIKSSLSNIGFKLPEYHNMEWRFETQIASRSMLTQCEPFVTMDFALKNADDSKKLKHIVLQSDATNLLHIAEELEAALLEGSSQQLRKIKRSLK